MTVHDLPRQPSLEWLRNESRELQRKARLGDREALAVLEEHHPRSVASAASLPLTSAQLAVARSYGFASWPKLRDHVATINRYFGRPDEITPDAADPVGQFLTQACLTYGADGGRRLAEAGALLDAHPEVATASVSTMAAANEVEALRASLAADPSAVHRPGAPHPWEPLLFAAYARVPGRSTLEAGRVLLEAGADPNAGYLWDGTYPFTALTGVFGGGEDWPNQPRHPDSIEFARLLLKAGANPNDTQAIYNRMFLPDADHLELLFEFGLGVGDPSPWAARLGRAAWPIERALALNLEWAAKHGFIDHVRLLLDHNVDPNVRSEHPVHRARSAYELAELGGNREIADLLVAAGAERHDLDPLDQFVAACLRADRDAVTSLRTDELVSRAQAERRPLAEAASMGKRDAVRVMLDAGFDINAPGRTALHEAALRGDLELVRALLEWGADPTIVDPQYNSTPLGWAQHAGRDEVAELLAAQMPSG